MVKRIFAVLSLVLHLLACFGDIIIERYYDLMGSTNFVIECYRHYFHEDMGIFNLSQQNLAILILLLLFVEYFSEKPKLTFKVVLEVIFTVTHLLLTTVTLWLSLLRKEVPSGIEKTETAVILIAIIAMVINLNSPEQKRKKDDENKRKKDVENLTRQVNQLEIDISDSDSDSVMRMPMPLLKIQIP
ncbi:hypothetical protein FRX31_023625 [Thalictrum thalictroides]|uniref:Transmembrane protein n=1 Tax=Thalictrum thalictroides TaxID=46969 RepID=A0A7J6VNV4_THATH|nr:hypothetical protein FRX31_023625 [Thalictrum thalictroides]